MRLAAAQKVHYDSGPNMTPLVDVVMVILIFLMLAGTFAGATHFLRSTTQGGGGPVAGPLPANIDLRVPVKREDQFSVAVAGTGNVGSDDALTARLEAIKGGLVARGTREEDIVIIIRPERGVTYQTLVKVHSAALAAKVNRIAFATAP